MLLGKVVILVVSRYLVVAAIFLRLLVSIVLGAIFWLRLIVIDDRLQMVLYLNSMQRCRVLAHIRTNFHMLCKLAFGSVWRRRLDGHLIC